MEDIDQQSKSLFASTPLSDPCRGFICTGLFGALLVLIGGSVLNRDNLKDEIFSAMYGGFIMGGCLGAVGLLLFCTSKLAHASCIGCLSLAALFSAPIVGIKVYGSGDVTYSHLLLDWVVGGFISSGGICATLLCCCLPIALCVGGGAAFGEAFGGAYASPPPPPAGSGDADRVVRDILAQMEAQQEKAKHAPVAQPVQDTTASPAEVQLTVSDA
jgi:hypothetical protein